MNPSFEIEGRFIGPDHPPLIIVEIGINHGGNLDIAKKMVDAAKSAGAEIIKHQTHIVQDEMAGAAKKIQPINADTSIYELMENCALNETDERSLQSYCQEQGLTFISTPFSRGAADRLHDMNVPAYKIGSGEFNNIPLLRHIASFGKPMILSSGMNDLESVRKTVAILEELNAQYALLHCTNLYPTPPELVRLGAIPEMIKAFPNAVIGLSDHTIDEVTCLGAVALGADILERHFTDCKERKGPDIICSMDPNELHRLIKGSHTLHKARGGSKSTLVEEKVTSDFAFASVVSVKPIGEGEFFSYENLWVKRPGIGEIPAREYEELIGQKASQDIPADTLLKRDHLLD
jgi:sialic acid synthase SpsE